MHDLRWRDLGQHEGPAEPAWASAESYPEDNPNDPYACRAMPTRSCPGTTGCPVLCARLESDDETPWADHWPRRDPHACPSCGDRSCICPCPGGCPHDEPHSCGRQDR